MSTSPVASAVWLAVDVADQLGVGLHLEQLVLDGGQVGLGQIRRLLADGQCRHADHRQVVVVDGDAALVLVAGQRRQRLHVGRIDLGLVEADRVVAELFGDAVALAVDDGGARPSSLRGKRSAQGSLSSGSGSNRPFSTPRGTSMRVDHHHVPVAGLRLLDDGEAGAGALELLDVDLDVVGLLEGLQQRRIGMVAPDQRVEIGGLRRGCRPPSSSAVAAHAALQMALQDGKRIPDA